MNLVRYGFRLVTLIMLVVSLFTNLVFSTSYFSSSVFEGASELNAKDKDLLTLKSQEYLEELAADNYQSYLSGIWLEQKESFHSAINDLKKENQNKATFLSEFEQSYVAAMTSQSKSNSFSAMNNIFFENNGVVVNGETFLDKEKKEKAYFQVSLNNINYETGICDMKVIFSESPFSGKSLSLHLSTNEAKAAGEGTKKTLDLKGLALDTVIKTVHTTVNKQKQSPVTSTSSALPFDFNQEFVTKGLQLGGGLLQTVLANRGSSGLGSLLAGGATKGVLGGGAPTPSGIAVNIIGGVAKDVFSKGLGSGFSMETSSPKVSEEKTRDRNKFTMENSHVLKGFKYSASLVAPIAISSMGLAGGNPIALGAVAAAAAAGFVIAETAYVGYQYYKSKKSEAAVKSIYANLRKSCEQELDIFKQDDQEGIIEIPHQVKSLLTLALFEGEESSLDVKTNEESINAEMKEYASSIGLNLNQKENALKVLQMIKNKTLIPASASGDIDTQGERLAFDKMMDAKISNVNFLDNDVVLRKAVDIGKSIWKGVKRIFGHESKIELPLAPIAKVMANPKWDEAYKDYLAYKKCRLDLSPVLKIISSYQKNLNTRKNQIKNSGFGNKVNQN